MANRGPLTTASAGAKGAGGPWTARRKRPVTAGEVRRAQQQAVGGRRKRCTKGKNCSAACIGAEMVCLVEFPTQVQQPLSSVRDYLMAKNSIQPGSIQDKRINAALGQLSEVLKVEGEGSVSKKTGLAKPEVEWKRDPKRAERQGVSWAEVQGLKKRRDMLSEAEIQQDAMRALHKDALSRGLRLPRQELEMIYDVLPKNVQTSLAKSGRAGSGEWYNGRDENGNPVFSRTPGKERALAVLDMWFRQGGTDAYQGRGGRVWSPPDLDVEHMRSLSKGGRDLPSNWVLARAGANRARQAQDIGKWIDRLPSSKEEYKNYLATYAKERRAKQARKARLALVDPKKMSDAEVFSKGGKTLAELFRGENGGRTPDTFTKEWLGIASSGGRKGNSGPPAPFAKGLGIIAKTDGLAKARSVGNTMKRLWNEEWKTQGSITKQQVFTRMIAEMEKSLTPEQYNNLFLPSARAWAKANDFL